MPLLTIEEPSKIINITSIATALHVLDSEVLRFVGTVTTADRQVDGGLRSMAFIPQFNEFGQFLGFWKFTMLAKDGRIWRQEFRAALGGALNTRQTFRVTEPWALREVLNLIQLTDALLVLIELKDVIAFDVNYDPAGGPIVLPPDEILIDGKAPAGSGGFDVTRIYVLNDKIVIEYEDGT